MKLKIALAASLLLQLALPVMMMLMCLLMLDHSLRRCYSIQSVRKCSLEQNIKYSSILFVYACAFIHHHKIFLRYCIAHLEQQFNKVTYFDQKL